MCSLGGNRKNRPGRTLTAAWLNRYGSQGILRPAEKTDFRRHSTPLEGMNTIKFCWQRDKNRLSEGIMRPLRLTKTTGLEPLAAARPEAARNRTPPYCAFMQPTAFGNHNRGSRRKFDVQRIKKIMHGSQVNRDSIEKQHGRMNLLQPIISIVRHLSASVKGRRWRFFHIYYSFLENVTHPDGDALPSGPGIRSWWAYPRWRKPGGPGLRGSPQHRCGRRSGRWHGGWLAPRSGQRCDVP